MCLSRASRLLSLSGPEGTDSEPRVDYRVDESSDVPILEERSSSPIDFLQEQWLVGTDIENIERYADCELFLDCCEIQNNSSNLQITTS